MLFERLGVRRRLGLFRVAAVIIGFGCVLHFAHRECAKNTDMPVRMRALPAPLPPASSTIKSKSSDVFHATAYCLTGLTAAGIQAAPGVAAADPKVIPLGSVIHVDSPVRGGIYQVMDTGALIKGKIIDIFIPSYEDCLEFGRRAVKVKVLRYGFNTESRAKSTPPKEEPAE